MPVSSPRMRLLVFGGFAGEVVVEPDEHAEFSQCFVAGVDPAQCMRHGPCCIGNDERIAGVGLGLTGVKVCDPAHRQSGQVCDVVAAGPGNGDRQGSDGAHVDRRSPVLVRIWRGCRIRPEVSFRHWASVCRTAGHLRRPTRRRDVRFCPRRCRKTRRNSCSFAVLRPTFPVADPASIPDTHACEETYHQTGGRVSNGIRTVAAERCASAVVVHRFTPLALPRAVGLRPSGWGLGCGLIEVVVPHDRWMPALVPGDT